jgi:DNA-binding GntR family transcriptional regulator
MKSPVAEFDLSSLSILVYEDLKRRLNEGSLQPGEFIDLAALGTELGMSRTPLRDALIRRRGVMVRALDLATIRDIYEMIGALEASVAQRAEPGFDTGCADRLDKLGLEMRSALDDDDFASFYAANLAFHDVYLSLSDNRDLVRTVKVSKERLYDFPRRRTFIKDWEIVSMDEHSRIAALFREGDFAGAAAFIRDVHWSFEVQERYIRAYYFSANGHGGLTA